MSSLPVRQVGNSVRLPAGAWSDTWCAVVFITKLLPKPCGRGPNLSPQRMMIHPRILILAENNSDGGFSRCISENSDLKGYCTSSKAPVWSITVMWRSWVSHCRHGDDRGVTKQKNQGAKTRCCIASRRIIYLSLFSIFIVHNWLRLASLWFKLTLVK